MYLSPRIIITTGKKREKRKPKAQVLMAIDILSYKRFEREWGKTKITCNISLVFLYFSKHPCQTSPLNLNIYLKWSKCCYQHYCQKLYKFIGSWLPNFILVFPNKRQIVSIATSPKWMLSHLVLGTPLVCLNYLANRWCEYSNLSVRSCYLDLAPN